MKLTVAYVTYLLLFLIQKSVEQSLLAFRLVYLMDMNGIDDNGEQSASTGHRFSCFVGTLSVVQN